MDNLKGIIEALTFVLLALAFSICIGTAIYHAAPWVLVSIYYAVICIKIVIENHLK